MTTGNRDEIQVTAPPVIAPPPTLAYVTPAGISVPPGWTGCEFFTLAPGAFRGYLGRAIALRGLSFLITWLIFFAVAVYILAAPARARALMVVVLTGAMLLIEAAFVARIFLRLRRLWPSYRLIVADQGIVQLGPSLRDATVPREQIRRIVETRYGFQVHLTVGRRLGLIKGVLEPQRLRERLQSLAPVQRGYRLREFYGSAAFSYALVLIYFSAVIAGVGSQRLALAGACSAIAPIAWLAVSWRLLRMQEVTWVGKLSVLSLIPGLLLLWLTFVGKVLMAIR